MQYDYVIVGAGLFGSVFAQVAREAGKSVLVIERRPHIGGNCYSYEFEDTGINVHAYGTHIFHTNDERIWGYVNRFTGFNTYRHRVKTTFRDRVYSMPINLGTVNDFYGVNLRPFEVDAFLAKKKPCIKRPRNLEEKAISLIGEDLYEAFIKGYTAKQWGCDPRELPASIITRLPVRTSYDDSYFGDRFQGIPLEGYTPMFERLLEGVDVELGVDFMADASYWRSRARRVVYSGPIDRYFGFSCGRLNWRSVRFEQTLEGVPDYQGTSVMNFAEQETPYTRVHEPKHLHPERRASATSTVVIKEFSHVDDEAPYYPVNFAGDQEMLRSYQELAKREEGVVFGGRLASYKYYDMHQVIGQALVAAAADLDT